MMAARLDRSTALSQLDFRTIVAEKLMRTGIPAPTESDDYDNGDENEIGVPRLSLICHFPAKHAGGSKRRCVVCHTHTPYICKKCNVFMHIECMEKHPAHY